MFIMSSYLTWQPVYDLREPYGRRREVTPTVVFCPVLLLGNK